MPRIPNVLAPEEVSAPLETEALLTARDVAAWFQCSPKAIYSWTDLGQFPHVRIGRLVRFRRSEIEAFLRAQARGVEPRSS